jgi:choline-glycine betaine transporter
MLNPGRFWSVLWAVVTGMFLGSMIAITALQVPLLLQQLVVGFMFGLYVLVMVSGILIPMPKDLTPRRLARPVRFQRYPYHSRAELRPGTMVAAKKEK